MHVCVLAPRTYECDLNGNGVFVDISSFRSRGHPPCRIGYKSSDWSPQRDRREIGEDSGRDWGDADTCQGLQQPAAPGERPGTDNQSL